MATDVYVDLLFLIDFFMDLVCLSVTARAARCRADLWRMVVAAAVGGAWSVAALFLPGGVIGAVLTAAAGATICFIAFYRWGDIVFRMAKLSLIYFGVNAVLGGCVSASFYLLERIFSGVDEEWSVGIQLQRWVYLSLAVGCFLTYAVVCGVKRAHVDRASTIQIEAFDTEMRLSIFADSGNLLREPIGKRACVVISSETLGSFIGSERAEEIALGSFRGEIGERICVIPSGSVNASGVIFGFFPRATRILDGSGKVISSVEVAVAVSREASVPFLRAIVPTEVLG